MIDQVAGGFEMLLRAVWMMRIVYRALSLDLA